MALVSAGAEACENGQSDSCGPAETLRNPPDQNQTLTPVSTPPTAADMVSPNSTSPGSDETIAQTER